MSIPEFGLFLLSPRRQRSQALSEVIGGVFEQVRLAEEAGFDAVWFAEHHFSNLSVSPSPLMAVAHAAGITRRIALGAGVAVLPLYHPMRLFEEVCYADHLSGGRLRLGIGSGSQNHESRALGTDIARARARFIEALDVLESGFDRGRAEAGGPEFGFPETAQSLEPLQRPHPPIYLAGMSEDEAVTRRAAARGYTPFASAQWMPADKILEKRHGYEVAWRAVGQDPVSMPFAVQRVVYVAGDRADARDAAEQARYTGRVVAAAKSGRADFDGSFIREQPIEGEQTPEQILEAAMIGDAERCAAMIVDDVRRLGITHLSCFMQMGSMETPRVLRAIERFAKDVMPAVRRELAAAAPAAATGN